MSTEKLTRCFWRGERTEGAPAHTPKRQPASLAPGQTTSRAASSWRGALAWIAGLLALVSVFMFLTELAASPVWSAGPALTQQQAGASQAVPGVTVPMTYTVFLPFLSRQESVKSNVWNAEYFSNPNLSGEPVLRREEARVDHDWGDAGAPPGLPIDDFSARYTGHWEFEVGYYTFFVFADDGVSLRLDNELVLDEWHLGRGWYRATALVEIPGLHELRLEYFEKTGGAAIRCQWRRTDVHPEWKGAYHKEPWVSSPNPHIQTDNVIQFDWGLGCPTGLNCDSFSVSWTATPVFEPGIHRIHMYADDGYQLLIDGVKVQEGGWQTGQAGGGVDATYDFTVAGVEYHHVRFNFHDRAGTAEARLWIVDQQHPKWTVEYYSNKNLEGTPVSTGEVSAIFRDWGQGRPSALPHSDNFSIRWRGQRYFHAGAYRFHLFADDGVRLWVDGVKLIDAWTAGRGDHSSRITFLSTGYHDVVVEYFEQTGGAEIRFWWE